MQKRNTPSPHSPRALQNKVNLPKNSLQALPGKPMHKIKEPLSFAG